MTSPSTKRDIVFVTADSVRADFVDSMDYISAQNTAVGITGSHYTRTSLASLLSASYGAAVQSRVTRPTIANVLGQNGYFCIGLAPSPQTSEVFGFDSGFDIYRNYVSPGNRGSRHREFLGRFDTLRKIYHRFFPPHAKRSNLPADDEVVETALKEFEPAPAPRFLWIHLMDSHRPYGSGETAVPVDIDRKALFAPNRLSTSEIETIDSKYRAALQRVDDRIERLVDGLPTDPILIFSSDHGDEFGEEGRYFHQPQRCRVVDSLVEVPVASSDLAVDFERCSLLDLAPTLLGDLGIDTPDQWHGKNLADGSRHSALTIAPWNERATIGWRDFTTETTVIGKNADVTFRQGSDRVDVEQQEIPDDLKDQLRDLGYRT